MPPPLHTSVIDANRMPVRVLRCARAQLWPWWHLTNIRPTGWLLYANDRDGSSVTCAGRRYLLRRGQTTVLPPGVGFDTAPSPDTNQVYIEFDVPGLPVGMPTEPTQLGADPTLAAITTQLHEMMVFGQLHHHPVTLNLAHAWIRLALARVFAQLPALAYTEWAGRGGDPLEQAVEAIERELDKPLYVSKLAERCGMGPQWFTRRFQARFNKSPAQYLLDRRVEVAAQRLAHDHVAIDQVASACGFSDRSHFSRAFTKRMGLSPARYRAESRRRFREE